MNSAIVCGFLIHEPELEYENKRGKKFLRMYLSVPRESGTVDMIPVVCREDKLIDADVLKVTGISIHAPARGATAISHKSFLILHEKSNHFPQFQLIYYKIPEDFI